MSDSLGAAPAEATWDAFFDAPGIDLPERDEPPPQPREELDAP